MITRDEIRALTRPLFARVAAALGQDLEIVPPGKPVGDFDDDGRRQVEAGTSVPVRGLLMPASTQTQQAAAGSDLPIPKFEVYLPHDAPVAEPGWHLMFEDVAYYPTADARDEGLQGLHVVWFAPLGAPGEVIERGEP
ncbi:hypothetical protein [Deinococcus hopiensis]|uniref:Uncharacterized protein n=1 Tax=Deinococcus hopiensis KR-140 TaxID=695939 RepID=A0A1W1UXI5_9DEIO|nr:hypothetical protein [Deinococcus hopiensis]SMB85792.1 hypothetical protein SAMN00790413_03545 [Deinococcus hopiensis KR-140]